MLIRFNVKNFLSFSEKQNGQSEEFSMISGKTRRKEDHIYIDDKNNKIKLLKFAAIYGANAAGKSNIIKAMNFMKLTILRGEVRERDRDKYCKVNLKNKTKPSYFEIEIILGNGKCYSYGFEVLLDQKKFVSEWLVEVVDEETENLIFERTISNNGTCIFGDTFNAYSALKTRLDVYADDIKNDTGVLFLQVMNQNKKTLYEEYNAVRVLNDVYDWIKYSWDITYPTQPLSDYVYLTSNENIQQICKLVSAFGTGITDCKVIDVPVEKMLAVLPRQVKEKLLKEVENEVNEVENESFEQKNRKKKPLTKQTLRQINMVMRTPTDFFMLTIVKGEVKCKTIEFCHGNKNALFKIAEESDGTIRLLDLLEILFAGNGKTYIVDELDRCLHPSLTYKFIESFIDLAKNKNIQLIVTTHESRLLDFDLLRRDEIWFVNKRVTGESDIYSLEEYNERFDKKIDRAYLDGRYGGVPVFNTLFPIKGDVCK